MIRMRWQSRFQFSPLVVALSLILTGALSPLPTEAAMVRSLDLDTLSDQADRIFRGTVISIQRTTVEVGGGQVPAMVYRLRVTEAFKGSFDQQDGELYAELRMVTSPEGIPAEGARPSKTFAFMPRLEEGGDYLLLITRPSAAGLSAPVGLSQGCFTIDGSGDEANVWNGVGSAGSPSRAVPGADSAADAPQTYGELSERLRRSIDRSARPEAVERVQR